MLDYKIKLLGLTAIVTVGIWFFPSCKKYDNPASIFQDYTKDSLNIKTRKIVIIGIDGFAGADFEAIHPSFLDSAIYAHSKYTMHVSDEQVNTDASAWTSWATGVSYVTHQSSDSSFSPIPSLDAADEGSAVPATIFSYVIHNKPLANTLLVTPWSGMNALLLKGANKKIDAVDDLQVRDSAAYYLKNSKADLTILEFNSVALAGQASSFSPSNPVFSDAVNKVDGYIKSVVDSIKSRPSYDKENWLIVISTNKGPDGLNPNPGFMMVYNKNFSKEELSRNGDQAPVFNITTSNSTLTSAVTPSESATDYDILPTTEMTISFKLKINQLGASGYNHSILMKTNSSANSNDGWWFVHNSSTGAVRFVLNPTTSTTNYTSTTATLAKVGEWHTYTGKVYKSGTKRLMKIYFDGVPSGADVDVTNLDCTSPRLLTIGGSGSFVSGTANQNLVDLRIYNTALPDDVIAQQACKLYTTPTEDSYYNNLIGYWPCNEAVGPLLLNLAPNGYSKNSMLMTNYNWAYAAFMGNNTLCYTSSFTYDANKLYSIVPRNCDVTPIALDWLRIAIKSDWGFEGTPWTSNFEREYSQP